MIPLLLHVTSRDEYQTQQKWFLVFYLYVQSLPHPISKMLMIREKLLHSNLSHNQSLC